MSEPLQITPEQQEQMLRAFVKSVMGTTVRGAMAMVAERPPEHILVLCTLALGQIISEAYVGDEIAVHRFRKTCRDAFSEMTKKMPIVTTGGPREMETADISGGQK